MIKFIVERLGPDGRSEHRREGAAFTAGLFLIAVVTIAMHVMMDRVVVAEQMVDRLSELATAQRLAVQRLCALGFEYAHASSPARRTEIRDAMEHDLAAVKEGHRMLVLGGGEQELPGIRSAEVDRILFEEPYLVDQHMRRFVADVREYLSQPWNADLITSPFLADFRKAAATTLKPGLGEFAAQHRRDADRRIGDLRTGLLVATLSILAALALMALFVFRPILRRLIDQNRRLLDLAHTDPLTGCHNRRSFTDIVAAQFDRLLRYGGHLSAIMIDIDKFKSINDTHGHAVGDEVIKAMAGICLKALRKSDVLGRLGGEEFAIVLPETDLIKATLVAEKLRAAMASTEVPIDGGTVSFTASFGVTQVSPADDGIFAALERADRALYDAKQSGRNRVVVHSLDDAAPTSE